MKIIANLNKVIGTIFFLLLLTNNGYGQVGADVFITNVQYLGTSVPNCGTINLGSSSTHNVSYNIKITRPYGDPLSPNTLDQSGIVRVKYSSFYGVFGAAPEVTLNPSSWAIDTSNDVWYVEGTGVATISSANLSNSGGELFGEYDSVNDGGIPYESTCNYLLTTPKFTMPSSLAVSCGSAAETFTVTNVNNSPGTQSYVWDVGSSWSYNGSVVTSPITTNSNSISLEPTTYPLSDVLVTPKLDSKSYPQLTTTISLSSFSAGNLVIGGAYTVCTSRNFYLNGAPTNSTITWSVSNTSIASVTPISATQATVTSTGGNGVITLTALVTNECGQTDSFVRIVNIGGPTVNGSMSGDSNPLVGEQKWYSIPAVTGATSYQWLFDVGGVQYTTINGWEVDIDQGDSAFINVGTTNAVVVCKVSNSCGNVEKYMYVTVRTSSDPCPGEGIRLGSNPMKKDGGTTNKVIYIDDPCDEPFGGRISNKKYTIKVFDKYGKEVFSKTQIEKEFDVSKLKEGFYIVKYQTSEGKLFTKKLIVQ